MSNIKAINLQHPSAAATNLVLNSDGSVTQAVSLLKQGTTVATTSGTNVDFTGIPSWAKRVTVLFAGVSTNGSSIIQIQLGTSGGFETSGYLGAGGYIQNAGASGVSNFTSGFGITQANSAASVYHGSMIIASLGSNQWVANGAFARSDSVVQNFGQGSKTLSGVLDRVRITTVNGTDTFDAGSVNILYE